MRSDTDPDEVPDDEQDDDEVDPLEGLMDPERGDNSPAADADAPPPPG